MSFLSVAGLCKSYRRTCAVDGIDLDCARGTRTAVIGPSGSGKTTLLRLIMGFEPPDAGSVVLDGEVLAGDGGFVPAHRRGIGVVAQEGALFPHLSVADNIGFGLGRSADRAARVRELAHAVELDRATLGKRPHELSGGQQQRVALARALARKPRLMLLDEPFSALDTNLRDTVRKMTMQLLRASEITTLLVTHDQSEAMSFADQVAVLRDGRLVQAGTPRELYTGPVDAATATLVGEAILLPAELCDGFVESALGRVRADTAGRTGRAGIMLRPEQLRMEVEHGPPAAAIAGSGARGTVMESNFEGPICSLAVAVAPPETVPCESIVLRFAVPSFGAPPAGATVRICVSGPAHIFREAASANRRKGVSPGEE